ncbi:hypothetical protein Tco_1430178 [Tanacetum coccineum]
MSDTVPLIPPPFGANTGNPNSPNRVGYPTDTINNTTTTSVVQNVVDENLLQLLDSRGGSHVTNVLKFDKENFSSWKIALEGERVKETFTRLKCLLNDLENNGILISQAKLCMENTTMKKDSDSDIEEDQRSSSEFLADLNTEFHKRALFANQRRFYKMSKRVGSPKKPMDMSNETFKYKGLKAEITVLAKKINAMNKGKSAFMAIADEELSVGITMKKVQKLISITNSDERRHVLDYTHVDLHYVKDQRKNLLSPEQLYQDEITKLNLENESLKDEIYDLKKVIEKWTSSRVTLDQLLTEQIPRNIRPLPSLPKLMRAGPSGITKCLTIPKTKQTTDKVVSVTAKQKAKTKPDSSTEKLLLTLMQEVKGLKESKSKLIQRHLHLPLNQEILEDCYIKPKCSTCGSIDHLTKEHPEQIVVKRTLAKLKAQSSQGSLRKVPMIPKPYIPCKYYGFNDHHSDEYEYYHGCDLCGSIAHETTDCVKKTPKRKTRVALQQSSEPTTKWVHKRN